jgi:hypothetical protein
MILSPDRRFRISDIVQLAKIRMLKSSKLGCGIENDAAEALHVFRAMTSCNQEEQLLCNKPTLNSEDPKSYHVGLDTPIL